MGSALVLRFLEARNWPAGSAYAAGLILIMLVVITVYLWFMNRGRQVRDVSVL
jgi:ABC-type spermidine/putrescine transport system permease subunit I